jgi:hypothetical protein
MYDDRIIETFLMSLSRFLSKYVHNISFFERKMHSSTPSPKSGNDFKDVYLSSLQQSIALSLSCVCLLHAAHSLLCRAHYCVLCFFDMLIFSITNVTYNLQASLNRRV